MGENRILTELPIWENGIFKGKTNWKATVGMELELLYKGEVYKVKIVKSDKYRLWVDYNGYVYDKGVRQGHFLRGSFGRVLNIITNDFKYEIGINLKDNKRDLVVTDRKYIKDNYGQNRKWYKYTCNKCGWTEGWVIESSLKGGTGCACCCNPSKILVPEINSIKAKTPWMIDLGVSEEDALTHTCGCNDKIEVTCPDCGKKKIMKISNLYKTKSIACTCGDGRSYPEKFMTNLLMQLGIDFETEYNPKWIKPKRYDFYIPEYNMIIETHGEQHYKQQGRGRNLETEQENDKLKKELALNNGIEHYIELDCFKSNMDYLKENILNSKLNKLFDLTQVDWLKCEKYALKNIVKEVCNYWNNKQECETTADLEKVFSLSRTSIIKYLHKGTKLGWCYYDPKEEKMKGSSKSGKSKGKPMEIFKNGISLGIFESCYELERQSEELFGVRLLQRSIYLVCRGKQKIYRGFTFKYIENNSISC